MREIFSDYGIVIHEKDGVYLFTTDSGGFVSRDITFEVSKEDAKIAQISEEEAYWVILKYEKLGKFKF
ncbi:hypothetical protein CN378_04890 [Bacillus sp. AFS015802]|uniref:hypothetical protein n=1 Tax=Bacillus sp. AFS015802 TaxID=2033486 RepID=UPI000BF81B23|nr:hypothetical protein [Bacillus sp. AFS015802]PFA69214.1 hypothetical protein CN378_04890 [Bacillus sp. AFS015802]